MIALPPQIRVFLYRLPIDMRKNFHGLVALTESALMQGPLSGSLFMFVNRRRDRIKILYWGQTGFCIWYQQLQNGTYQLPDEASLEERQAVEVTRSQLSLILDGIDPSSARQCIRFRPQKGERCIRGVLTRLGNLARAGKLGREAAVAQYQPSREPSPIWST